MYSHPCLTGTPRLRCSPHIPARTLCPPDNPSPDPGTRTHQPVQPGACRGIAHSRPMQQELGEATSPLPPAPGTATQGPAPPLSPVRGIRGWAGSDEHFQNTVSCSHMAHPLLSFHPPSSKGSSTSFAQSHRPSSNTPTPPVPLFTPVLISYKSQGVPLQSCAPEFLDSPSISG